MRIFSLVGVGALAVAGLLGVGAVSRDLIDTDETQTPAADAVQDDYSAELGAQVRAYLLANPGVILEVFKLLEQQEAEKKAGRSRDLLMRYHADLFDGAGASVADGVMGNPAGIVQVVEFFDYQCGYCKASAAELKTAMDGRTDVAVILKEFPILGPASETASRLALAIKAEHGDAAYLGFHNALLAHRGNLNDETMTLLVEAAGYDHAALTARGRASDITEKLTANRKLAADLGINGSPAFVFRDELVGGMMNADRLTEAFNRLAR
jgi:protein-disulfide isomerase